MLQEDRGAGIPPLSSMSRLLPWRKQLEPPGRTVILHLSSSDTNYNLVLNSLIPRLLADGGKAPGYEIALPGCFFGYYSQFSLLHFFLSGTTSSVVDSSSQDNPLAIPDFFNVKEMTNVCELFKSRVHLGHKTGMWNPLMKRYIYGCRDGIHIIDLDMTLEHLRLALNVTGHIAYRNGIILFVNKRSQFERLVQQTARDCGEYFVTQRWRGGTLTNSFMLLGTLRLPDLAIFLSVPPSKTAIKEVAMCNIPSIGIVDTDCDPNLITYPIPGNDDTPSAMKLYCGLFCDVINRAKAKRKEEDKAASNKTVNSLFDLK